MIRVRVGRGRNIRLVMANKLDKEWVKEKGCIIHEREGEAEREESAWQVY